MYHKETQDPDNGAKCAIILSSARLTQALNSSLIEIDLGNIEVHGCIIWALQQVSAGEISEFTQLEPDDADQLHTMGWISLWYLRYTSLDPVRRSTRIDRILEIMNRTIL